MSAALRLLITDYQNPDYFRWRLEDSNGRTLADHDVHLDTSSLIYIGYTDLPIHLARYAVIRPEADILAEVGDWIGKYVFGSILPAIVTHHTAPIITVAVVVPSNAQDLLARPLELARLNGKTLTEHKIRMIYEGEGTATPNQKTQDNPLRILAVFSLPDVASPLNLRQERYDLETFVHRLQAGGKATELRVLQYGATRNTLEDALNDGDGWDILHFSGHGLNGALVLEMPDGAQDIISADDLASLLDAVRGHVQLLFLSACLSGATSLSSARRALGLTATMRDATESPEETTKATLLPNLGQKLAERLDCAVLAMRYSVGDQFAINLCNSFYQALLVDRQPLPRALNTALTNACTPDVKAAFPLSAITPILFGACSADLRLSLAERPSDFVLPPVGMAQFPIEPERFIGRLKPMVAGREVMAERGIWRGILYYGMAGAGKTTIAAELAYRYRMGRFRRFVWYTAPPEGGDIGGAFASFLDALYHQLELNDTSLLENADRPAEFNSRTLPRLRQYLRQNTCLIVIDNLEGLLTPVGGWRAPNEWGPLMEALLDPQSQSRLLLTSRYIPTALATLPQLQQAAVHALSLPEAVLLARELPNLNKLFADDEGVHLLYWTLHLVQGHPKLLEFADKLAADRAVLQEQLKKAALAAEGNAALDTFFETGETRQDEPQFLEAFTCWTRNLEDKCSSPARLLLQFLASLEKDDRDLTTLEIVWPVFLSRAPDDLSGIVTARAEIERSLKDGLQELVSWGLIEEQIPSSPENTPTDFIPPTYYLLHPTVAETVRRNANSSLHSASDITLADWHYKLIQHCLNHEIEGFSSALAMTAKGALPYLVRQQEWDKLGQLALEILQRDPSPGTRSMILALMDQGMRTKPNQDWNSILNLTMARTLSLSGRIQDAEVQLRELATLAAKHGDFRTAYTVLGDLTNLLLRSGYLNEALSFLEQEIVYARKAGASHWAQLAIETKRLQVHNKMGQWNETLIDGKALLKQMEKLTVAVSPEQPKDARPNSVFELLFDTLREAALRTEQYELAVEFNASLIKSQIDRNADLLEIARYRFNDYAPLRHLRRHSDAQDLLYYCRDLFVNAGMSSELGKVYGAIASLEADHGELTNAIQFLYQSLLCQYRTALPDDCAHGHSNLATIYTSLGQHEEAKSHRIADAVISLQSGYGDLQISLWNLALDDLSNAPPSFDWVVNMVERIPGVHFRELFARLPQRYPDGDAAIVAVWEMARRKQDEFATRQTVLAAMPPNILAAIEMKNTEALKAALAQLAPVDAEKVIHSLKYLEQLNCPFNEWPCSD